MNAHSPMDERLLELVEAAVIEGLERVQTVQKEGGFIAGYSPWPSISFFENGMPNFDRGDFRTGGTDYGWLFARWSEPRPVPLQAIEPLVDYIKGDAHLKSYFRGFEDFLDTFVAAIVHDLVDRYVHVHNGADFNRQELLRVYTPLERGLLAPALPYDVVVPILFLHVACDDFQLSDSVRIERMPEEFQLSRAGSTSSISPVAEPAVGAATHALRFTGFSADWRPRIDLQTYFGDRSIYPTPRIDQAFGALRVVTGYKTGYAQLLAQPFGWTREYRLNRVPLMGATLRAYPPEFDDYFWLEETVPTVSTDQLNRVAEVFRHLEATQEKRLHLALRRVNSAMLRENEEDAMLDATIGLEALLSDDGKSEMTQKLALRLGALGKLDKEWSPAGVFRVVKKLYDYRSAIVHGSADAAKKRAITLPTGNIMPAPLVAIFFLGRALTILLEHLEYLIGGRIDAELLLGDALWGGWRAECSGMNTTSQVVAEACGRDTCAILVAPIWPGCVRSRTCTIQCAPPEEPRLNKRAQPS